MAIAPKPVIKVDGDFSDWVASERIDFGDISGYSLYATVQSGFLYFDLNYTTVVGPNTTIWLNTDLNAATGYQIFGFAGGAEYNVNIKADGTAALYTGADGQTLVLDNIQIAYSADHTRVELAIPLTSLGNPNNPIGVLSDVNNTLFAPGNYSGQPYIAPSSDVTRTPTHKVAIVYSDTTAANYFRGLGDAVGAPSTTYSDLFMAAQNQARMAGVSYDVIDESQLTDINNLIGYDALIFPAMTNVNTAQLPTIMSALTSAVYDYHIGIITSGDFLTNDQTGAALANPYANMQTLLGLTRASGGNSGDVTVTAVNDGSSPIMQGYANGEVIQSYSGVGYTGYAASGSTPYDVLVNQNVAGVGTIPGVVETTVGGATNVHFATQGLLGDSNLLSDAIQSVVLGTNAGVVLHTSRQAGIVAARMDMDQAQNPADVSPASGTGIYDKLIPILQGWKTQYNFVGSYYVDIGNQTSADDPTGTDWTKSLPYYQQILAMGGEIGTHSYTHLINPPTTTFTAHVVGNTAAGSTTITLDQVPSFYGITVGMWLTGTGIGSNTLASGAVVHTQVIAVSGNTITIGYDPDGAGPSGNVGTLGALSNGQTLTFSIPTENTNFLEPTTGADPIFTYAYEFGQSKADLETQLGITTYGAAVPGAAEALATSKNILAYFPSANGQTGYVTGGWTGIESGYPSAFGYLDPTQQGSVYIAPNVTFDFTEIQYQGKTVAQALADWQAQVQALSAHAAGTPIVVWPIHDYGAADWNTSTNSPDDPLYTTQLYTSFIQQAYSAGYEFVTLEDLASRIAAQEKAQINYTTSGNTINVTITPDASAPDLGKMALDVVNNGTQVIQSVTNWYAYNAQEIFLPYGGGSFTINLGTTQADVTHIAALPMRGDLLSVTGDGSNLSFSVVGDGNILIDLAGTAAPTVTGATIVSQVGDQLTLGLTGLGQHDITILLLAQVTSVALSADSGSSATDFITNVASQTITGTLSGPLGAGDVVMVSLDNGATWLTATVPAGAMSFSLAAVLPSGPNTLIARVENSAGAFSTPMSHAYVLDQIVPAAPTTPDLIAAADSGVSSTDNLTNVRTPTFTGTAEIGSTVSIYDGATKVGTGIADANGIWTITTSSMANGVHVMTAKTTDVAGNVSVASGALSITIDATAPTRPALPDLVATSDTGVSSTDNITRITTPSFAGTANALSTVTVYDGTTVLGTTAATALGTWSLTAPTLSNGTHSITVKAADAAGNVSAASSALALTIDTTAPGAPAFTGANATTLRGTGEAGDVVTILNGTTTVGTTTVGSGGSWSWSFIGGLTPLTFAAFQTDKAGNVGGKTVGSALIGSIGNNTLTSTAGNDILVGAGGTDRFVFNAAFGQDIITDFAAAGTAHDIINFHGIAALRNFNNVMANTVQTATGVVISNGVNTLTLNGVAKTNLTVADFTFV